MSNYTQLGLVKQTDGENTGTWGDVLNETLIDLLDDAIGGYVEVSVASGNVTLAFADGTADNNGRHSVIKFTGSPGTTRTVTFPDAQVNYLIIKFPEVFVALPKVVPPSLKNTSPPSASRIISVVASIVKLPEDDKWGVPNILRTSSLPST